MSSSTVLRPRRPHARRIPLTCIGALVGVGSSLAGCEYDPSSGTEAPAGNVVINDENNFSADPKFDLGEPLETKSTAALTIDWSKMESDFQCNPINADNSIGMLTLAKASNTTWEQLQASLPKGLGDNLDPVIWQNNSNDTSVALSAFGTLGGGTAFDLQTNYAPDESASYLLVLASGHTIKQGAKSMMFLKPTESSTLTTVEVPGGCNRYSYNANLHELTKVPISKKRPWVVDWSGVKHDGQGFEMTGPKFNGIDELMLYFYANKSASSLEDITDLEDRILQLDSNYDQRYQVKFTGHTKVADLARAEGDGGSVGFPGFGQTDGIWLLALRCTECSNYPAPIIMTILNPT
jgi:hypothetical protein